MNNEIDADPSEIGVQPVSTWDHLKYPLLGLSMAVLYFLIPTPEGSLTWLDDFILLVAVIGFIWKIGELMIIWWYV